MRADIVPKHLHQCSSGLIQSNEYLAANLVESEAASAHRGNRGVEPQVVNQSLTQAAAKVKGSQSRHQCKLRALHIMCM